MALGEGLLQVKSLSCGDVKIALCLNDIQDAERRPEAEEATKGIRNELASSFCSA